MAKGIHDIKFSLIIQLDGNGNKFRRKAIVALLSAIVDSTLFLLIRHVKRVIIAVITGTKILVLKGSLL